MIEEIKDVKRMIKDREDASKAAIKDLETAVRSIERKIETQGTGSGIEGQDIDNLRTALNNLKGATDYSAVAPVVDEANRKAAEKPKP